MYVERSVKSMTWFPFFHSVSAVPLRMIPLRGECTIAVVSSPVPIHITPGPPALISVFRVISHCFFAMKDIVHFNRARLDSRIEILCKFQVTSLTRCFCRSTSGFLLFRRSSFLLISRRLPFRGSLCPASACVRYRVGVDGL